MQPEELSDGCDRIPGLRDEPGIGVPHVDHLVPDVEPDRNAHLAGTLCKSPERLSALLMLLLEWLRDVLLFRHGADTKQFFNTQHSDDVMRAAQQIEPCRLNKKIVQVSQLMTAQNHNINMQLGFEALLLS